VLTRRARLNAGRRLAAGRASGIGACALPKQRACSTPCDTLAAAPPGVSLATRLPIRPRPPRCPSDGFKADELGAPSGSRSGRGPGSTPCCALRLLPVSAGVSQAPRLGAARGIRARRATLCCAKARAGARASVAPPPSLPAPGERLSNSSRVSARSAGDTARAPPTRMQRAQYSVVRCCGTHLAAFATPP
jgi:hypothetical protein